LAGDTVIDGYAVVVEGADADELAPLLLEHHVLAHHVDDVGALLDGLDRARVDAGKGQGHGVDAGPTGGGGNSSILPPATTAVAR